VTFFRIRRGAGRRRRRGRGSRRKERRRCASASGTLILEGKPLDGRRVQAALRAISKSGDPFNEATRPKQVTREPQLVLARNRDDGSVLLTFVVEGSPGHVITNFSIVPVVADQFFNAVVYPKSGFVEVRTNQPDRGALRSDHWDGGIRGQARPSRYTRCPSPRADFEAACDRAERGKPPRSGARTLAAVRSIQSRFGWSQDFRR